MVRLISGGHLKSSDSSEQIHYELVSEDSDGRSYTYFTPRAFDKVKLMRQVIDRGKNITYELGELERKYGKSAPYNVYACSDDGQLVGTLDLMAMDAEDAAWYANSLYKTVYTKLNPLTSRYQKNILLCRSKLF